MKNFRINFCHPVKGVIKLFKKEILSSAYQIPVHTDEGDRLNVSLSKIPIGEWNIVLEWEYEEKQYSYRRQISIDR